jgi:hypothetical protein
LICRSFPSSAILVPRPILRRVKDAEDHDLIGGHPAQLVNQDIRIAPNNPLASTTGSTRSAGKRKMTQSFSCVPDGGAHTFRGGRIAFPQIVLNRVAGAHGQQSAGSESEAPPQFLHLLLGRDLTVAHLTLSLFDFSNLRIHELIVPLVGIGEIEKEFRRDFLIGVGQASRRGNRVFEQLISWLQYIMPA